MKATSSRKFKSVSFLFLSGILLTAVMGMPAAFSQEAPAADESKENKVSVSKRLQSIEVKLDAAAERENKILENQANILEEIQRSRTWRRKA